MFNFSSEPATLQNVQPLLTIDGLQIIWDPLEGYADGIHLNLDAMDHTEVHISNSEYCLVSFYH